MNMLLHLSLSANLLNLRMALCFFLCLTALLPTCTCFISPLSGHKAREMSSSMALPNDYEEVLAAIQQELFSHSHQKDVSKSAPCMEITDKNATMIKSIGRTTKSVVDVDPVQKFEIAYCSSEGDNICAVDSTCATIYRWKRANIRHEIYPTSVFEMVKDDEILVPQGCTCVINSMQAGHKSNLPIIIF